MAQRPADAFNGNPSALAREFRVVISPYAKQGHISHQENSHVSLVKFCETTFGLAPLDQRDNVSHRMSDCFDFAQRPLAPPRRGGR